MEWTAEARRVIADVHASLPADATMQDRIVALRKAYPFGAVSAARWPYKAWLVARKEYLARFTPRALSAIDRLPRDPVTGRPMT